MKDLSKKFEISESMIRKDLQVLEKMKLLQRTYGGAIKLKLSFIAPESFNSRITKDAELKEVIAVHMETTDHSTVTRMDLIS